MRKLSLRHEVLADLTTDDLMSVGGASGLPCDITRYTCLPTCGCTGYYRTLDCLSREVCIQSG